MAFIVTTDAKLNAGPDALPNAEQALVRIAQLVRDTGYCFITPTPATHERVNARLQNDLATDLVGVLGWSRRFYPAVLPAEIFSLMCTAGIVLPAGDAYRSLLRLSKLEENLYFHSAYPTNAPDAVFFGPDTYRFIAVIKRHIASRPVGVRRAIDVGCGAGAGAVTISRAFPGAEVVAADISDYALRLTRTNARVAEINDIVTIHSNLLRSVTGSFDLIVANPPYLVDPSERAYRHGGGEFGWDLSLSIVETAIDRLAPNGTLILYTGVAIVDGIDLFYAAASKQLRARGVDWTYQEIDPDVFGEELLNPAYAFTDRIAAVVLTVMKQ